MCDKILSMYAADPDIKEFVGDMKAKISGSAMSVKCRCVMFFVTLLYLILMLTNVFSI